MTTPPIVRFAPSPTGRIHIGNARTALFNWLFATSHGGQFVLRYDDTDTERSTAEFADGIAQDLSWLGIKPHRIERQSSRFAAYDRVADDLRERGVLYPCYETPDEIERKRKRLMARGLPPVYDRAALKLSTEERADLEAGGRQPHWRFLLPNFDTSPFEPHRTEIHWNDLICGEQTVDLASMSDPVLIRGDGTYLYTLPSVIDDIEMGITHVIRGADHITNTGAQIALFEAVGGSAPAFGHHNLLTDGKGEGLSKRLGSLSIESLRERGYEAMAVASLATLIGTSKPVQAVADMQQLRELFDPESVSRSPARFSEEELASLNEKLLHEMPYEMAKPGLQANGADGGEMFWHAVRPNLQMLRDAREWFAIVQQDFERPDMPDEDRSYLGTALELLPEEPWPTDVWKRWTDALKARTGRKGRALFMPLRIALTGKQHGPDMADLLPVIGPKNTRRRLS